MSLTDDMRINDENIRDKQITIEVLKNELEQKQQNLDELIRINQGKKDAYGTWMSDCLQEIQNEERFHKKPIGPVGKICLNIFYSYILSFSLGYYIQCIDSRWSYAVEKHLAPIMSAFICTDNHDEKILVEILTSYSLDQRPPIYVRAYSDKVHDISGTLKYVKQANLLSMYDVLKINDITVECALVDFKHIEATVLLENLEQARQIRKSGVLRWEKIDRKVKQVVEAWTYDGSNIKLDKTFRIYTNDRQPMKYFLTHSTQSLSIEQLEIDMKRSCEQIQQMYVSTNRLLAIRKTTTDKINKAKKASVNNENEINELTKVVK